MKNFKYPLINLFFDADNVPCVFVEDILKNFIGINCIKLDSLDKEYTFDKQSWEVEDKIVMAYQDFILYYDKWHDKEVFRFVNYDKNLYINLENGFLYDKITGDFKGQDNF